MGHIPVLQRHVKRHADATYAPGESAKLNVLRPSQTFSAAPFSDQNGGMAAAPFDRAAKPQDYSSGVNERELHKYIPQRMWP